MKVPLSWLKDFVEIDISIEALAHRITLAGLEVEQIHYLGLPVPERGETKISGLEWDREKFVVAQINEVMPHPDADRLILCRLYDGQTEEVVLTGAPNLFPYKGKGRLETPLKVAYAREGARLYDGHKPGWELMTLKRTKIRGVESRSMVCSEKELGISEEHEGIIIFDDDAPLGPLVDYIGDAVFEIAITPNIARNANMLGVAREIATLLETPLKVPDFNVPWSGAAIAGKAAIEIRNPELNPRFILGLIEDIEVKTSPYWMQLRLRLAGMRPINNVVDTTNYVLLEIGEPLHAFDYDILKQRANGATPTIITRQAQAGEKIRTLDDADRELDPFTVLVCDTAGALSIAGVMGGAESEVTATTKNVLLEAASWNFINIRQTVAAQRLDSEASYRFSRGVHPAIAERGARRALTMLQEVAGGTIADGFIDAYPLVPEPVTVTITPTDVRRSLGIDLTCTEIAALLSRLEFEVQVSGEKVQATTPDHRLDIGRGLTGVADLMEEIARIYGYDRIPETQIADTIPPQYGNPALEYEENLRDLLASLGLQEVITYRLTSPERESRLNLNNQVSAEPYVEMANPISSDRTVMRRSLLSSVLEILEQNAKVQERQALFEIGPVYIPQAGELLPSEKATLVMTMTGKRSHAHWQGSDKDELDFYDLKGIAEAMLQGLHLDQIYYETAASMPFHPGMCAALVVAGEQIGILGQLHPLISERYAIATPILAARLDLEKMQSLAGTVLSQPVPAYPPVFEDLAIVVDEDILGEQIEAVICKAGRKLIADVRLFDIYRGEQIGSGKKSLAYSIVYQASDRTLTDKEVSKIRSKIIFLLGKELNAELRS